jgi:ATP-dependent exoDNAse (exonuclease V) beta subunit
VGKAFGTLVHELLSRVRLDAGRTEVDSLARSLGRLYGNNEAESEAAAEAAFRALAHPLFERARSAALCLREAPLAFRHSDGTVIEGVVDLAFRGDVWTVVDFKTDARTDIRQQEYRRQLGLYAAALVRATTVPARGILLYV